MKSDISDKIADLQGNFQEIKSCIVIFQMAVQTGYNELTMQDIDNYLEVLIEKFNTTIKKLEAFDTHL